jgi:hypothetical protein
MSILDCQVPGILADHLHRDRGRPVHLNKSRLVVGHHPAEPLETFSEPPWYVRWVRPRSEVVSRVH